MKTIIFSAPQIEEFPGNTTAIEGEEVVFKVVVSGSPTPTLTWKSGGQKVFSNYAMTVENDGTLTFPSTEINQSGVYILEACNSAGKIEREVKLEVQKECEDNDTSEPAKQISDIKIVPVNQFGDHVEKNHSCNNLGFRQQFQVSIYNK